jgi:hypothetical protein
MLLEANPKADAKILLLMKGPAASGNTRGKKETARSHVGRSTSFQHRWMKKLRPRVSAPLKPCSSDARVIHCPNQARECWLDPFEITADGMRRR